MNFKEKVKQMTAAEIITAMVEGLKNPKVEVDMLFFGNVKEGICYGCAATNAICQIEGGAIFNQGNIYELRLRSKVLDVNRRFLACFEDAVDCLRLGFINGYNERAKKGGFAEIVNPLNIELPHLGTYDYEENLQPYIDLANSQPK